MIIHGALSLNIGFGWAAGAWVTIQTTRGHNLNVNINKSNLTKARDPKKKKYKKMKHQKYRGKEKSDSQPETGNPK